MNKYLAVGDVKTYANKYNGSRVELGPKANFDYNQVEDYSIIVMGREYIVTEYAIYKKVGDDIRCLGIHEFRIDVESLTGKNCTDLYNYIDGIIGCHIQNIRRQGLYVYNN